LTTRATYKPPKSFYANKKNYDMSKHTFYGIQRHMLFSPNHIGNDAAIFNAVADYLRSRGHAVTLYTEQDFLKAKLNDGVVFDMVRSKAAVRHLQRLERKGLVAVNSGFGIENCTREKMTRLLLDNDIPHPDSVICSVTEELPEELYTAKYQPCWIKRADFHAIHKEDVTYVRNVAEMEEMMGEYALRNIERVVVNQHLVGDLIKFYGVHGTDFFYWFYPYDLKHSKFGLEAINGEPTGIPFSADDLKGVCDRAAEILKVDVYGGDAIVDRDGTVRIIDFNDWPSFAPCRREAADAIGQLLIQKAEAL